jgi:hypothetical protein
MTKRVIFALFLGVLIMALLSQSGERASIPLLSPPIPPVPPICQPGQTDDCVPWSDDLRDWRPDSPLPLPQRSFSTRCGKRYHEDWCN